MTKIQLRLAMITAATLVAAMASTTPSHADPGPGQPPAAASPVLFVVAHPDDETLAMGVSIAEHAGENVHVLILTAGTGSSAINMINGTAYSAWCGCTHNPATEGYSPLTVEQFGQARQTEA